MEIIRIPGYTEDEKVEIAKRHLLPKEIKAHGLKDDEWKISDGALRDLIRYYTREAGVRSLEREIANCAPQGDHEGDCLRQSEVDRSHGGKSRHLRGRSQIPAMAKWKARTRSALWTGLAWTEVGGDTLQIESVMLPGKGRMQTTGKLGDVMKESIDAARSYVRSKATTFGASSRRCSISATFMSTCRKVPRRRTDRLLA